MGLLGTWANSSYEANPGTDFSSGLAGLTSDLAVLSLGVAVCVLCLTTLGAPHCQQCAYLSSMPVPQLLQRHITGADIIRSQRRVKCCVEEKSRRSRRGVISSASRRPSEVRLAAASDGI